MEVIDKRGNKIDYFIIYERVKQLDGIELKNFIEETGLKDLLEHICENGFEAWSGRDRCEVLDLWKKREDEWFKAFDKGNLPWDVFFQDPLHDEYYIKKEVNSGTV